jgi:hypothetical protein
MTPAALVAGLTMTAWGGQCLAVLAIDAATWDGRKLVVEGTDGRGGTVNVYYGYEEPNNNTLLGQASVRGNGAWKLQINTNPNSPLDPVPCAVSAFLAGDDPIIDFPVAGAPADCAPQPPTTPVCNISVDPTTLDFGTVIVGNSSSLSTTISNSGAADCNVTVTAPANNEFQAAPLTLTVVPNASQVVSVTYSPVDAGQDSDTLTVNSNDPDTPAVDVNLSGTGSQQQQACNLSVSPTSLSFGDVQVGTTSTLSTTISSTGSGDCNVTITPTGSTDFTASPLGPFTLVPGSAQVVTVDYTPAELGIDTGNLAVASNDPSTPNVDVTLSGNGVDQQAECTTPADTSINSTSQSGCPDVKVTEEQIIPNATHSVLAINDLGMHCGDLDTRIASILPPFQVLLAQVVEKGQTPTLNPAGVDIYYSAASNANDPVADVFEGVMGNGDTFKTNFWDFPIPARTYDPFYPAAALPAGGLAEIVLHDIGLPVPNVEEYYIGPDGLVDACKVTGGDGVDCDGTLAAVLHAMPGIAGPYTANDPQLAQEHYEHKPFFLNFPFGYVAEGVNWHEGAGIPFAAFDDFGRENAYPLVRVQAQSGNNVLSTVDTVLPISGEASCTNCHAEATDYESVEGVPPRTQDPITALGTLPVATTLDDPDSNLPPRVSLEYAADINLLRLHDLKHGARYVSTACDAPGQNCLDTAPEPCDINANSGDGDESCLTNKALVQGQPVVCQVCHYTPALDLAQLGPLAGAPGTIANGRNQLAHQSNSRVMHNHHGQFDNLFTPIPAPTQDLDGIVTNQPERLAALEESCYQCHPGTNVQCLRGAMFNGDMLCSDCHGDMLQVGADFSAGVSPENPGDFLLTLGNYYDPSSPQPRVPWANEPGCGSCHTGDATSNAITGGLADIIVNTRDSNNNLDGIRLRQAFVTTDAKATPIVPANKRFAEPEVPASFNGFNNPGAGNPQLYRVSTGHGGVMCEGCHGATHAEWPNANANANDNQTAIQIQGHAGTIADCTVCHGNDIPGGNDGLGGPHGLHRIAFNSTPWSPKNVHEGPGDNFSDCATCHGGTNRDTSCGTVLSRALADRTLGGNQILAGEPVGCAACHDNGYWDNVCVNQ